MRLRERLYSIQSYSNVFLVCMREWRTAGGQESEGMGIRGENHTFVLRGWDEGWGVREVGCELGVEQQTNGQGRLGFPFEFWTINVKRPDWAVGEDHLDPRIIDFLGLALCCECEIHLRPV